PPACGSGPPLGPLGASLPRGGRGGGRTGVDVDHLVGRAVGVPGRAFGGGPLPVVGPRRRRLPSQSAFGFFAAEPGRGGAFGRDRVDVDANALPTPFGTGRPSGDRRCRCWGLHGPGHSATGIGGLRRRGHPEDGPSVPARSGGRRRPTRNTLKAPTTVGAPGPVRGRLFVLLRTEHDLVPRRHRGASAAPLAFGCGAVTAVGRSRGRGRLVGGAPWCAGGVEVDGGSAAARTVP